MTATLPSNSGDARFVIELRAHSEYGDERGFDSCVQLHGSHWNGDRIFPNSVSIEGLWFSAAELEALHEHITRWLRQPLDQLVADHLTAEFQLARMPGQSVHIRFGPRSDTISGHNPVVSITYSAGALHGESHFVTDQSCLAAFVDDLSAAVNGF